MLPFYTRYAFSAYRLKRALLNTVETVGSRISVDFY